MSNRNHHRDLEVMKAPTKDHKCKIRVSVILENTLLVIVLSLIGTAFMVLLGLLFIDVLLSVLPKLITEWRHLVEVWKA